MNLPTSWKATKLGDVLLSIVGGGTPSKSNAKYYKGNIPWMSVKDMSMNILNDTVDHISEEAVRNSSTKIIPAGTPIIATRMGLGKIVVANFDSAINQDLKALFPASGVNTDYLIGWYRSIARKIEDLGTGTTVKGIRLDVLNSLEFPLPPLAEQKIIADKLNYMLAQVEAAKSHLERIPGILKAFRQSVLSTAVNGKLTEGWRDGQDFSVKQGTVGDFASIDIGHAFKSKEFTDSGVKLLRGQNIEPGSLKWDETRYFPMEKLGEYSHLFIRANDIILAMDRPIISSGLKLARAKEQDLPCVLVQRVARFTDFTYLTPDYLFLLLKDTAFTNYIQPNQTGSNIPHISGKQILSYRINVPPITEQAAIVRRAEELFAFADNIEQKTNAALKRVSNLTQSILDKAFRGELTAHWRDTNPGLVSGNNSAKTLLEKIKAEHKTIKRQPKSKRSAVKNNIGNRMGKQIIKVVDALKQAGEPLSGQQLLAAAGYPSDSSTEQLEQFFLDIRDALGIERTIVKLERDNDSQDWFALANKTANE
ncbi:MAG: restriction endonuclease subunit S [Enterobacter cloacae]|nr:restriction endonuclease subunit S [Enterobacter cloacae]MDU2519572.1 restriction endonuclease subunit S [Enterobacter cloacae]MDU2666300.1 restriction endonuclease subunit S [Enterobacter cloacae]